MSQQIQESILPKNTMAEANAGICFFSRRRHVAPLYQEVVFTESLSRFILYFESIRLRMAK